MKMTEPAEYAAINEAWPASGIPTYVLQTPDWRAGWLVLLEWIKPHFVRWHGLEAWEKARDYNPRAATGWAHEIHCFSHIYGPPGDHTPAHAAFEAEGTRAILAWWHSRAAQ